MKKITLLMLSFTALFQNNCSVNQARQRPGYHPSKPPIVLSMNPGETHQLKPLPDGQKYAVVKRNFLIKERHHVPFFTKNSVFVPRKATYNHFEVHIVEKGKKVSASTPYAYFVRVNQPTENLPIPSTPYGQPQTTTTTQPKTFSTQEVSSVTPVNIPTNGSLTLTSPARLALFDAYSEGSTEQFSFSSVMGTIDWNKYPQSKNRPFFEIVESAGWTTNQNISLVVPQGAPKGQFILNYTITTTYYGTNLTPPHPPSKERGLMRRHSEVSEPQKPPIQHGSITITIN